MPTIDEENYLAHYGILRRSGRYPWGSGGPEYASNKSFLGYVAELRKNGFTDKQIIEAMNIPSVKALREASAIARHEQRAADQAMAQRLKDKGMSNTAIAERMYGDTSKESSVRALLSSATQEKTAAFAATADMLKREVDTKEFLDVGTGVENYLGVSKEKLNTALSMLKEQGYEVHTVNVAQITTGLDTKYKVLCPPGTTQRDVFLNREKIQPIREFSEDGGLTYARWHPPLPVNPRRVAINYAEDGGAKADGVLYVRPGVQDVSFGSKGYAQVRVKVGNDHYLKGMAVYKDDLPPGVDIVFNTNKNNTGNKFDAMKKLESDPDVPFKTVVRQLVKNPGKPNEKVISAMNLVGIKEGSGEEGSWGTWTNTLASQFLSKQSKTLAAEQLDKRYAQSKKEYDEIMALTNPEIKKVLLDKFAETTDSSAVHLEAAAMPRQNWRVILPINSLKESEVYAPGYRDGEEVVLVRFPHGGKFEIPQLTVNNRNREGRKVLGDAADAIGIHHKTAEILSGADFDGDTVLVIPNSLGKVKRSAPLEQLKGFDPKTAYPKYDGMKVISPKRKQQEMGNITNLITDMTIKAASHEELARAVKHSMVVIDAEKHELNFKQSEKDNGIRELKERYQGKKGNRLSGASTLLSRATSEARIPERRPARVSEGGPVDPKTGKLRFVETGRMRTSKSGEKVLRREIVDKLSITDDAFSLVSDNPTPHERLYAEHSNKLKRLANQARLDSLNTPRLKFSQSAKKTYAKEVAALDSKLALAQQNRPRERHAQLVASVAIRAKRAENPGISGKALTKLKYQELERARIRTGAKRELITFTDREWEAIQAGAISSTRLSQLLDKADLDQVKSLATPRRKVLMTASNTARAKAMLARGATRAEVAAALGVSLSTLDASTTGEGS